MRQLRRPTAFKVLFCDDFSLAENAIKHYIGTGWKTPQYVPHQLRHGILAQKNQILLKDLSTIFVQILALKFILRNLLVFFFMTSADLRFCDMKRFVLMIVRLFFQIVKMSQLNYTKQGKSTMILVKIASLTREW